MAASYSETSPSGCKPMGTPKVPAAQVSVSPDRERTRSDIFDEKALTIRASVVQPRSVPGTTLSRSMQSQNGKFKIAHAAAPAFLARRIVDSFIPDPGRRCFADGHRSTKVICPPQWTPRELLERPADAPADRARSGCRDHGQGRATRSRARPDPSGRRGARMRGLKQVQFWCR
jgi:hypothetical protein